MIATEKQVKIAVHLYRNRDLMRRLYGSKWPSVVREYGDIIREAMKGAKCDDPFAAVVGIEQAGGAEISQALPMLLAVAVEMIEEGA